jgi:tRNA (uracil-5-)-methyltransferase
MSSDITSKYKTQLDSKEQRVRSLLQPFYKGDIDVFTSEPEHFRMRAEFRMWHEGNDTYHIMFNKETKEQYRVDQLPAASRVINQAMKSVSEALIGNEILRKKLFQIDYLSTLTDEILVTLVYHKPLNEEWTQEITKLKEALSSALNIQFIGRSRKQKVEVDQDFVIERLLINEQAFEFKQIENSFTQPNALVNCKMIEWSIDQVKESPGDLLELYCGAGNFSVPMAQHFDKVLATEISKTSVNAAQFNIERNKVKNLRIVRLSSEEFVEASRGVREFHRLKDISLSDYQFSTVLVDPPRAGLDDATIALIQEYDNIIYISCNPTTLAENLEKLSQTHEISRAAIFDQFPFTEHIESGVCLRKN